MFIVKQVLKVSIHLVSNRILYKRSTFKSLPILTVIISTVTIYPTYTRIQLISLTISLAIHCPIFNFGVSHLRLPTNFYVPFCIKLIGRYSFNEKIKLPRWLLSNSIIVPEYYIFVLLTVLLAFFHGSSL